MIQCYTGNQTI